VPRRGGDRVPHTPCLKKKKGEGADLNARKPKEVTTLPEEKGKVRKEKKRFKVSGEENGGLTV